MGVEIRSSPAIAADGSIYFGCRDNKFYALRPDGKKKWEFQTGAWVDSSPAVASDGAVCFGSWDQNFYMLDSKGAERWHFHTGGAIDSSPAIDEDGAIYFGSHDKKFYALQPDGRKKWEFATGGQIASSPALWSARRRAPGAEREAGTWAREKLDPREDRGHHQGNHGHQNLETQHVTPLAQPSPAIRAGLMVVGA